MIKCLSTNKLNVIQVQYVEMLVLFQREYLELPKLVKTLFQPEANAEPSAPPDSGAQSITTRPLALKRAENDLSGWTVRDEGFNSLKVAESRVAFDVVLLLEAVKLGWVHVHSCQNLKRNVIKRVICQSLTTSKIKILQKGLLRCCIFKKCLLCSCNHR